MKKNGFTLLEMIAVITIIGILLIVVVPQLSKIVTSNKEDTYITYVKLVEDAAKTYAKIELGNEYAGSVTIQELMGAKYIKSDPSDTKDFDKNQTISIKKENGNVTITSISLEFKNLDGNTYTCTIESCTSVK